MGAETLSIIGSMVTIGFGLAVMIARSTIRLERRIDRLEDTMNQRFDGMETRIGALEA